MKTYIASIIGIVLLGSCSKDVDKEYIRFTSNYQVKLDSIKVPPILFKENKLIATKDYLISMSISADTVFHVFKLPNCSYIGGFGNKGNGPNDFIDLNISSFNIDNEGIIISDIKSVNHIELIEKNNKIQAINNNKYLVPGSLIPINYAIRLNDSIISGITDSKSEKEFVSFNIKTNAINYILDYPSLFPDAPIDALGHLYTKCVAISPKKNFIGIAYKRFPMIRVYNLLNKSINQFMINEGPKQINNIEFTRNTVKNSFQLKYYYKNLVATDKYFYAQFQVTEYVKNKNNQYIISTLTQNQLHVINWEGAPITLIPLKDWMSVYAVSLDNKNIYFINPFVENYIYKYTIEL